MKTNLLPTAEEVQLSEQKKKQERISAGFCPECVDSLINIEGCKTCPSCGWSACDN